MDPSISVAQAQEIMCDMIDAWQASLAGTYFTWNGTQWDCDRNSKANIIGVCVLALANSGNLPAGYIWRDFYNNNVSVTGAQMLQMGTEMATFITACYQASWQHKANVLALTTTADVESYDYTSTLWPNPMTQI
jgi:hypothetical protein